METFVLTEDHIKLLTRAYVGWQDCESGAPEIDPKRPYGNSNVPGDVADILGHELPDYEEEDAYQEACELMMVIHYETTTALQIVLQTRSFTPGIYRKRESWDARSWELVKAS